MGGFLKQYLWVLDLLAILLSSFFGAKLTTLYLAQLIAMPESPKKVASIEAVRKEAPPVPPFSDYKIILDRNVFNSETIEEEVTSVTTEPTHVPTGEPVLTSLKLNILGVLVVGRGEDSRSSATVGGRSGGETYAVGEGGFSPNTVLTRVQPDRIFFTNNGRAEYALIEEEGINLFGPPPALEASLTGEQPVPPSPEETTSHGATVVEQGDGKYQIDQREVQDALTHMERLYTEIRAVPNFSGGKVSGMKILSVKQGSIFDKLGLRRGDILERINGMELDVKKGLEIFAQLKDQRNLQVDLIRQGSKKTFEYDIR